jgi:peptidoglycan/xylan/chitin deacetylase (PgdA/CDA1 family)
MLSIGLHGRIIGRPARAAALERLLDHILAHDRVWVCRRVDIARHWALTHPAF